MASEAGSLGEERRTLKDLSRDVVHNVVTKVKNNPGRAATAAGLTAALAGGMVAVNEAGHNASQTTVETTAAAPGPDSLLPKIHVPPRIPGVERALPQNKEADAGQIRDVLMSAQEPELAASITSEKLPGYFETTTNGLTTIVIDFAGLDPDVLDQEIRAVDGSLNGRKVTAGSQSGTFERPVFRTYGKQSAEFPITQRYFIVRGDDNVAEQPFRVFLGDSQPSVKAVVGREGDNGSVAKALAEAYVVRVDGVTPGSPEAVDQAWDLRQSVIEYLGDSASAAEKGRSQSEVAAAHPGVSVDLSGLPTKPLVRSTTS